MIQYATDTAEMVDPFLRKLLNPISDPDKIRSTNEYSESEASNAELRLIRATKPITSLYPTCGPRPTVQSLGPGWSMQPTTPTLSVGSMASLDDSMLASSSQAMKCPFTSINELIRKSVPKQLPQVHSHPSLPTPEPGPCQSAHRFNFSEARASYEHQVPESARLQPMGSQIAIDAARDSPVLRSTAARSHSRPSMASREAHIHLRPTTTLSPQTTECNQDSPAHSQGMQPHLGSPPSENAAPLRHKKVHLGDIRARSFGVDEGTLFLDLPGSKQVISVPVDYALGSKKMDTKRGKGAIATTKYRKRKKEELEENLNELKNLREEKKEWEEEKKELHEKNEELEEKMKELHEKNKELEEKLELFQGNIRRVPSPCYLVQGSNLAPQASNIAVGMDGLATRPQSRGRGSLPGERFSKRRRTDQALELSTSTHRAFMAPATSRRLVELPPRTSPKNTSTRWLTPQDVEISTPSTMVASVW